MEIRSIESSSRPRRFQDLPQEAQDVCTLLVDGLKTVLADNLFGIYLYGALVFPETRYVKDIDLHVIVNRPLTAVQQEEIRHLHRTLAEEFPQVGDDIDAWYLLLDDAQKEPSPRHQINPDLSDASWALHRAHIRAGFCIVLHGPEPEQVFPAPTWPEIVQGLEVELGYVKALLTRYPEYCILNLCRLIYSYQMKNAVISKRASAEWTLNQSDTWGNLIEAALRVYEEEAREGDKRLLESEIQAFYQFACDRIKEIY